MSVSSVPKHTVGRLWGKSGGRCQYRGCNKPLWKDSLTQTEFNTSYVAHIIADKPDGPRGDPILSEKLKAELSNLMLLCDAHHRLIDKHEVERHSVELLTEMKEEHERRIEILTDIQQDSTTQVVLYGANIGKQGALINYTEASQAVAAEGKYPANGSAIELSMRNSSWEDCSEQFWEIEKTQLHTLFERLIRPDVQLGRIHDISIFALAPQPLLIELGRLCGDITKASVFQKHREPATWTWPESDGNFEIVVERPSTTHTSVAINFSISATIDNQRVHQTIGKDVSIWTVTVDSPHNDIVKRKESLSKFRKALRSLFDEIKYAHGEDCVIHVFPAVPVSIAVEIGRVWMPKADLPLLIYDQNRKLNGFVKVLEVK